MQLGEIEDERVTETVEKLKDLLESFLAGAFFSIKFAPRWVVNPLVRTSLTFVVTWRRPFREICRMIYGSVMRKFGDENFAYQSVGGFLFLRFFCPAIVTPQVHRVVEGELALRLVQ